MAPKIFISYRRSDSESVSGRIFEHLTRQFGRAAVFKDVDGIEAGENFRSRISESLLKTKVLLVVIGPGWVTAQNESGTPRLHDKDDHVRFEVGRALANTDCRVIPVLVNREQIPKAHQLPEEIREMVDRKAVDVRPDPDFNSDMGKLCDVLANDIPRKKNWLMAVVATVICVVAVCSTYWMLRNPAHSITSERVSASATGLFDLGPSYLVEGTFSNLDDQTHFFSDLRVEFDPPASNYRVEIDLDDQVLEFAPGQPIPVSGTLTFDTLPSLVNVRWRLCVTTESETHFGHWQSWIVEENSPSYRLLEADLASRVRIVDTTNDEFMAICVNPPQLYRISVDGSVLGCRTLNGLPMAVAAYNSDIAVAVSNPPAIHRFSSKSLESAEVIPIPFLKNEDDEQISTSAFNIALNETHLWVATSDGTGEAALLLYDRESRQWSIPHDNFTVDSRDLVMRTAPSGEIMGVSVFTSPSSLYQLHPERVVTYGGHDVDDISNATDFRWVGQDLLLRDPSGTIFLGRRSGKSILTVDESKAVNRPWESVTGREGWSSYLLAGDLACCYLALTMRSDDLHRTELVRVSSNSTKTILQTQYAECTSLGVIGTTAIVTLRNGQDKYRTILVQDKL